MSAPTPGSDRWRRLVTASKVAGIMGWSPWDDTPLTTWHRMRGEYPWPDETPAMRRGSMLENAVLDWWLADNPAAIEKERQPYYSLPGEDWCGATPDMLVEHHGDLEFVDAKTVADDDYFDTSRIDGAPLYYVASSMWQLAMAPQVKRVRLAVLFGRRFDFREFVIERDDAVCDHLVSSCRAFYDSLDQDVPPPLSDRPAEYDVIRTVHPDIDRDEHVVLDPDVEARYLLDVAHEKRLPASKALVLNAMGTARLAKRADGTVVARRQPKGDAVTLVRVAALPDLEGA